MVRQCAPALAELTVFTHALVYDGLNGGRAWRTSRCLDHWLPVPLYVLHNPDTWTTTNGIPVTIDKALEQLSKYRRGLKIMSGGFTLSGGEPLMQDRFAVKLLKGAKALGIHTALDTNGSLGQRLTDAELEDIDLVLLDIKSYDAECHRRVTGAEVGPVLDFARLLASRSRDIWLRFVLVPGYTDDPKNVAGIAHFIASLGNVKRVDVLPFHQMGRFKWKELKLTTR